jgi:hypothetical protein
MRAMLLALAAILGMVAAAGVAVPLAAQTPPTATLPPGSQVTSRYDDAGFQSVTVQNQSSQGVAVTFGRAGDAAQVTIAAPAGNAVRVTGDAAPSAPSCAPVGGPNVLRCTIAFSPAGSFFAFRTDPLTPPTPTPTPASQRCLLPERELCVGVRVTTDKAAYVMGEAIAVTLVVTNPTDAPITLNFSSGQQYDFIVRDAMGAEVWRWSRGRGFIQALTALTLQPRETELFTERWDQRRNVGQEGQPVPPGAYSVTGVLTSSPNARTTDPAAFTIAGQGPAPTPSPGLTETIPLPAGCTNVVLTWAAGTPLGAVAANVAPANALVSIFRLEAVQGRFIGYSPIAPAFANDYTTVASRLEAVFVCLSAPGRLTRPTV